MPDYTLARLSTRTFEQLTQSLAQKHLGARALIFGDGPDGAREAEFQGTCKLPPLGENWTGRVVLQAKFLQIPYAKPTQNSSWLLDQLATEMDKFSPRSKGKKKAVRQIDYYVLATNVINSGVAKKGGKDRVTSALDEYKAKLGWKGWILWDYNEIGRMLDDAADIRVAYSAWITSGDVFMEMLRSIKSTRPNFEQTMLARLQEDFTNAQYAKLRQAGHGNEDKTPLSRLFVDLPITHSQLIDPPDEQAEPDETGDKPALKLATFLDTLLAKGDERLTPADLEDISWDPREIVHLTPQEFLASAPQVKMAPDMVIEKIHGDIIFESKDYLYDFGAWASVTNRIVLLGGPGQGKTTLGQFACQLYRAALLTSSTKPLMRETRDALRTLRQQCGNEVRRPSARRYPVWIDLKELAKWLAQLPEDPPPSLLTFIAKRIGTEVDPRDLKEWLRLYPWFVVFDGLDEVPPSSGRERMLRCIQSFITEAHTLDSDLLVLCTTRPQGYSREFDQRYYRHQWLAPLSSQRALAYGEKVLDARHGKSGDDRKTFGIRLAQAAENPMTARVMRSPLQVTIMAALVERVGKPPEQRWKLFTEYYAVIYERERERGTAWSDALAKYDAEVNAIHRRVGWRLQVRSEASGNSDARLSAGEFKDEVSQQLTREGHSGQELEILVALLGDAATERLVFLVAVGSEEVGFEIRPLQEFMAADHLFEQGDRDTAHHLKVIAPIAYWRNVFLFASGRVFAERRNLRDNLLGILDHLNEDSEQPAAKLTLAGSVLALDLLEDGSANHIPASRDALMRKACRLLDVALPNEHRRLAVVGVRSGAALVLKEEVERRLAGREPEPSGGARGCLLNLLEHCAWAQDMWINYLPVKVTWATYMLDKVRGLESSTAFKRAIGSALKQSSPFSLPFSWIGAKDLGEIISEPLVAAAMSFSTQAIGVHSASGHMLSFGFIWHSIVRDFVPNQFKDEPDFAGFHQDWKLLWIDRQFLARPSSEALATALESLSAVTTWPISRETLTSMPWPIISAVANCNSWEDIPAVAAAARSGQLGDFEEWKYFERLLDKDGLEIGDISSLCLEPEDARSSQIQTAAREAGLSAAAARLLFGNLAIFSARADHEVTSNAVEETNRFLEATADQHPTFAASLVRTFARMEEPPFFGVATFIRIARTVPERQLPVSVDWLEMQLLETAEEECGISEESDLLGECISEVHANDRRGLLQESTTRSVNEVINAIAKRPGVFGLWRLLSLLPAVPDPKLYQHILGFLPHKLNPEIAADVTVLRARAHFWTASSAPDFAAEILEAMAKRPDLPRLVAEVLENVALSDFSVECLPAALLERLPREDWQNRCILRGLLRRLYMRRTSNLTEIDDQFPGVTPH